MSEKIQLVNLATGVPKTRVSDDRFRTEVTYMCGHMSANRRLYKGHELSCIPLSRMMSLFRTEHGHVDFSFNKACVDNIPALPQIFFPAVEWVKWLCAGYTKTVNSKWSITSLHVHLLWYTYSEHIPGFPFTPHNAGCICEIFLCCVSLIFFDSIHSLSAQFYDFVHFALVCTTWAACETLSGLEQLFLCMDFVIEFNCSTR